MKTPQPFGYIKLHYQRTLRLLDRSFEWKITGRWVLYSALIGVAGAVGALVFSHMVRFLTELALLDFIGYAMPAPGGEAASGPPFDLESALRPARRWLLFLVPALGGLLSGWLVFRFAPEAEGHGTDGVIHAFHRARGIIRPRVAIVKTLASSVTIGTGGSAGQEGPIAQIGATLGSYVATRLHLNERDRRMLLVAGMAAGIGSIFRSPLGGAFFAVEVLYREDIESRGIMPATIAAITGYSLFSSIEGSGTVFTTPQLQIINPLELLPLIGFAVVCAVMGILYTSVFYKTKEQIFEPLPIPRAFKPAVGGALIGTLAFFFPAVLGSSYGWLQQAIEGNLPMTFMLVLVFAKILATSFTIGSGGSGGVFAPSLVIGGMLGGLYGQGLAAVFPQVAVQPHAYVMIGMATFFTGVANVPIATTIMICEMTGSYVLLVPLIFAGVVAHLLARRWSLYKEQVRNQNESPAHSKQLVPEIIADIKVRSIIQHPVYYHKLAPDHTVQEIISVFTRTKEIVLPVLTDLDAGQPVYTGLVLLDSIQPYLDSEEAVNDALLADDLAVPFASVSLDDTLDRVLATFEKLEYPELPVLNEDGLIVGFVRPAQVVGEYHRAWLRKRKDADSL